MKLPPTTIDGAQVIEWASSEVPVGYVSEMPVYGLAICKYAGSEVVYRFSCDQEWETLQDADYGSVCEAKQKLPDQY